MASFTHHIFVCGNDREPGHSRGSCGGQRANALRDAFKKAIKAAGVGARVRANSAGCLDQCEHGPVVVVYPQNIWYGHVGTEDAARIVERTVIAGEIVEDLKLAEDCLNNPTCPHRVKASS
jgi:(2Fe-2S) ferredoxin